MTEFIFVTKNIRWIGKVKMRIKSWSLFHSLKWNCKRYYHKLITYLTIKHSQLHFKTNFKYHIRFGYTPIFFKSLNCNLISCRIKLYILFNESHLCICTYLRKPTSTPSTFENNAVSTIIYIYIYMYIFICNEQVPSR